MKINLTKKWYSSFPVISKGRAIARILFLCNVLIINYLALSAQGNENDPEIEIIRTFSTRTSGISLDADGNILTSVSSMDSPIKSILKIGKENTTDTICTLNCFAVQYLKTGPDGSVYACQVLERGKNNANLVKINGSGIHLYSQGFIQPVGITFDEQENLYLIDAMLRKVYRISPDGNKTVFIDLDNFTEAKNILYHGIDYNPDHNVFFTSGINIEGGTGNILMFRMDQNGSASGQPVVVHTGNCKHVTSSGSMIYSTLNSSELLAKDIISGRFRVIKDPLLTNGMGLILGSDGQGNNSLYINTFDKIVRVKLHEKL